MRVWKLGIAVALVALLGGCNRAEQAKKEASALKERADNWRQGKGGRCPTYADLAAGAMRSEDLPERDPWGTPYSFTCNDWGAFVRSAGPDKKLDTKDDVTAGTEGVFFPK